MLSYFVSRWLYTLLIWPATGPWCFQTTNKWPVVGYFSEIFDKLRVPIQSIICRWGSDLEEIYNLLWSAQFTLWGYGAMDVDTWNLREVDFRSRFLNNFRNRENLNNPKYLRSMRNCLAISRTFKGISCLTLGLRCLRIPRKYTRSTAGHKSQITKSFIFRKI